MEKKLSGGGHREKIRWIILCVAVLLVNIKSIFCDFGIDCAYAMATSFRCVMGDRLFGEMCEPHMSSSFLLNLIMKVFFLMSDDSEGVVIFCQAVGTLLYLFVAYLLFLKIRGDVSKRYCVYIVAFFATARVKLTVFPEFSNMALAFSVILWICLSLYIKNEEKTLYLVAASVSSALLVLSYPTTVLVFLCTLVIGMIMSSKKKKFFFIYFGICFCMGILYGTYLVLLNGLSGVIDNIRFMLSSDESHPGGIFNMVRVFDFSDIYAFSIVYVLFMVLTLFLVPRLEKEKRREYILGWGISFFTFVSAALVTNLPMVFAFSFLILGVVVSLECMDWSGFKNRLSEIIPIALLVMMLGIRGIYMIGYPVEKSNTIFSIENYTRVGPCKWLVTSLGNCNRLRGNYNDWKANLTDEDSVLAVEGDFLDASVYMNVPVSVSHYSVICTPSYSEKLEQYWEKYPDKKPTVIAVYGYLGNFIVSEDSWIMQYIDEYYSESAQGEYWTFFRRKPDGGLE